MRTQVYAALFAVVANAETEVETKTADNNASTEEYSPVAIPGRRSRYLRGNGQRKDKQSNEQTTSRCLPACRDAASGHPGLRRH